MWENVTQSADNKSYFKMTCAESSNKTLKKLFGQIDDIFLIFPTQ